jgi:hypothetical protein
MEQAGAGAGAQEGGAEPQVEEPESPTEAGAVGGDGAAGSVPPEGSCGASRNLHWWSYPW